MRELQRRTRTQRRPNGINPTTIHSAFTSPRLARLDVIRAIVTQLGGDTAVFDELWTQARQAELTGWDSNRRTPASTPASNPPVAGALSAPSPQPGLGSCGSSGSGCGYGSPAGVLLELSQAYWRWGQYRTALEHARSATALAESQADYSTEATALAVAAACLSRTGQDQDAVWGYCQALAVARRADDRPAESRVLTGLGLVHGRRGRLEIAFHNLDQASDIDRAEGFPSGRAETRNGLGELCQRAFRYDAAIDHYRAATSMAIDDPYAWASGHNGLGEVRAALGQVGECLAEHRRAYLLAREVNARFEEARALAGTGAALGLADRWEEARGAWHRALTIFAALAVPEADQLRSWLATATAPHQPPQPYRPHQPPQPHQSPHRLIVASGNGHRP